MVELILAQDPHTICPSKGFPPRGFGVSKVFQRNFGRLGIGEKVGFSHFPVMVTTRIISCLVPDSELNLHLPLILGRGTIQCTFRDRIGIKKKTSFQMKWDKISLSWRVLLSYQNSSIFKKDFEFLDWILLNKPSIAIENPQFLDVFLIGKMEDFQPQRVFCLIACLTDEQRGKKHRSVKDICQGAGNWKQAPKNTSIGSKGKLWKKRSWNFACGWLLWKQRV